MLLGGPILPQKYIVPSVSAVEMKNGNNLLYLQSLLVNGIPNYRIQHCQFHLEQNGGKHATAPRKELYRTSQILGIRTFD